jgi:signal peptidase I
MRKLGIAIVGVCLIVLSIALLTENVILVRTHGNSMYPGITTGDLEIVVEQPTYHPGDVVAYHSRELREVVLHRIKAVHGDRYTFRGDHNDFDDPERPTVDQLIGREVIRIPGGGLWLDRLTAPHNLALVAFLLVAGGGTAANRRKRSRKKRPMAQHARSTTVPRWLAGLSPTSAVVVLLTAVISVVGIALSALAWTTAPTTQPRSALQGSQAMLTFSYQAKVPRSPVYEGTTVRAPDPLFRSLVHNVRLSYAYRGRPGTIQLDLELSSANGWHTRLPLQPAVHFDEARTQGQVDLDLDDLSHRAQAAAAVIGIPVEQESVVVVATVRSSDGETFAPRLTFALDPTQFRLASDTPQLEFRDGARPLVGAAGANTVQVAGRSINVWALRVAAGGATAVALSALVSVLLAESRRSGNAGTLIPRKYRGLLLEVEPIITPPGRPVVDVADFAALAKLAGRYGVLVMHWTRSHVQTFVVHDDGVTYRYRIDVTPESASPAEPTAPGSGRSHVPAGLT